MPSVDVSLDELHLYVPETQPPPHLAEFWDDTLAAAGQTALDVNLTPAGPGLAGVTHHQLSFSGLGGARITGWYARPDGHGPFPGVVWYHGYGGRGGRPLELYTLAAQGVAVLSMDCRGQTGDSPDTPLQAGHGAGWLTRGLADPTTHYYRYVYADAVRAVEALASFDEVDSGRMAVTGASQGGGLALAAAALSRRIRFVWADVPFLCDFPRGVATATEGPYLEVAELLRRRPDWEAQTFRTLAHFDATNLAPRVSCPAIVTVALWDPICPPSTIFGMFRRLANADKELVVLPYQGHDVPYEVDERRLTTLVSRLSRP
jgi:cephalosporin-C deacetylase